MTVKITWLGTADYILDIDGTRLFFDPFLYKIGMSMSELQTKRDAIKNIDAIFLTHGHYDHATDAAYFAEALDIPVYCSEVARESMINWAEGKILKEHTHPISDKAKDNIKPIDWFEKIEITDKITVESIQSKHIVFDARTILSKLFSWKFLKVVKSTLPFAKGFPCGKVFGFCTSFNNKKIVSFGSLCHEFPEVLEKYAPCDLFITPLAGNSNKHIVEKSGIMIHALKPKIVIPTHWDDTFPPVSWRVDLNPYHKYMERNHPDIKTVVLEVGKETPIELD